MSSQNEKKEMDNERKTISHDDYLKLLGLALIIKQHQAALVQLGYAVNSIVNEKTQYGESEWGPYGNAGHVGDFVCDKEPDASDLLRKLEIDVLPSKAEATNV